MKHGASSTLALAYASERKGRLWEGVKITHIDDGRSHAENA
jgi:hypothetical protein